MPIHIQLRRGTAADWTTNDSVVLYSGEIGIETDTNKFKVGDGATEWASLPYSFDVSEWSSYSASSVVDISGNAITNVGELTTTGGLDISGTSISGVTEINGTPIGQIGGYVWSTFPALQNVDMSGNSITGLSNINGTPISQLGGATWSQFKAGQTVDMSGNSISNAGVFSFVSQPVTQTFTATGANQTFTVPAGVTSLSVTLRGAGGGSLGSKSGSGINVAAGGAGALVSGTLAVTPGETLTLVVGGGGVGVFGDIDAANVIAAGGFGGGGTGYGGRKDYSGSYSGGGGGGGRSAIRRTTDIVTAGGGGGGYTYGDARGGAGGLNGVNGLRVGNGGFGGTQTAGGAPGVASTGSTAGSSGTGGNGSFANPNRGAGGGGGFFGGGGGHEGAGGGGSSLIANLTGTVVVTTGGGAAAGTAGLNTSSSYVAGAVGSGRDGSIVVSYAPSIPTNSILVDSSSNLQIGVTNNIRLTRPTEYRRILSNVSATSLTLATSNYSSLFRISNASFNSLTVPSLSSSESGVFWELSNTTASNLTISLAGTVGLTSPVPLAPKVSATLYWDGTAHSLDYNTGATGPTGPTGADGYIGADGATGPTGTFGGVVNQSLIPDVSNTYDIGSVTYPFRDIYLSDATVYLGASKLSTVSNALQFTDPSGSTIALKDATLKSTELSTYLLTTIENSVPLSSTTPVVIKTIAIPASIKGKAGLLNFFYNLQCGSFFYANQSFTYQLQIDGTPLKIMDVSGIVYTHSTQSTDALTVGSISRGTSGITFPLNTIVSVPENANSLEIALYNSTIPLSSITTFAANEGAKVAYPNTGTFTYTVPAGVSRLQVWLWGGGGKADGSPGSGSASGGGGAFISGQITVTPLQTLHIYVGGFSDVAGVFTSATRTQATCLVCAAGGGGSSGWDAAVAFGGFGGVTQGGNSASSGALGATLTTGANAFTVTNGYGGAGYRSGTFANDSVRNYGGGGVSFIQNIVSDLVTQDGFNRNTSLNYSPAGGETNSNYLAPRGRGGFKNANFNNFTTGNSAYAVIAPVTGLEQTTIGIEAKFLSL